MVKKNPNKLVPRNSLQRTLHPRSAVYSVYNVDTDSISSRSLALNWKSLCNHVVYTNLVKYSPSRPQTPFTYIHICNAFLPRFLCWNFFFSSRFFRVILEWVAQGFNIKTPNSSRVSVEFFEFFWNLKIHQNSPYYPWNL